LLFKLQRYPDSQNNLDIFTTKTTDNTECVQMLVAWRWRHSILLVCTTLVEHAKEFTWKEDELMKLYNKNCSQLRRYGTECSTWLMDNNMTLRMSFKAIELKANFELSIYISEQERDDYAMRPLWVDLER
jgi:hypothetical protein